MPWTHHEPGTTSQGSTRTGSTATADRLAIIEHTLRIQDITGATHLQQLEMNPEAFGMDRSSRPHVKRLRLRRNKALHGGLTSSPPTTSSRRTTSTGPTRPAASTSPGPTAPEDTLSKEPLDSTHTGSRAPFAETLVAEEDPQELKQLPNHGPRPQVSVDYSRITHEDREEQSRLAWTVVAKILAALYAEAEKDTEQ